MDYKWCSQGWPLYNWVLTVLWLTMVFISITLHENGLESKLHLKLMTDCKTEAEKTYKKFNLEIQNEQQMYKSHKPQELNSRRQTLQQSLACTACHLLRLQTDAHYDFVDRPIELRHH